MKKISNYSIRTTIVLLVTAVLILNLGQGIDKGIQIIEKNERDLSMSSLIPHDPISIISDSGLTYFPGSGTAEKPYIVEGYNITTTSNIGIRIRTTTKYFIVRNCYIDANDYGISIWNVAEGTATVINNTCSNNGDYGILLHSSYSSTVANNTCNNNKYGIYLDNSVSSTVTNNNCSNNNNGIYLWLSDSSTVTNNMCSYNNQGGIGLSLSSSSTVVNNTFTNGGLHIGEVTIDAYLSYTVENNWVNGKKLGFYINLDSTSITEPVYGQLLLVNCTNITIRDQILNNTSIALFLHYCTYSTINNNTCSNNDYGIYLLNSDNSTVVNNTCSNNNGYGIFLEYSDFCVVTYNLVQENVYYGIKLYYSDYNLIHHNNFVDNNLGGTSQAYEYNDWYKTWYNTWYDNETLEGNYWSDWNGTGGYSISGRFCNSGDLYPLDEPTVYIIPSQSSFALLTLIVPLILIGSISLNRKKKQKLS